ncbi:histidinol-phosphate aminotransferase [Palleronia aestuarii]|uniref:Histidinol-phosphate aminotransferase n=1 Tax=Palleronia aestuarii TaxID=568105 RepID=A0A2W7N6C4_9RHOB|nr:histidinol-phosphate transaminase [Palleronia aestuarii]PZX15263.1 histidinol-phosphate aminotransferase [Palleronia aestuarii]
MTHAIAPRSGILDIAPYIGGASHADGVAEIVKLSSNENPWGPPASAVAALERAARTLNRYPSTDHLALRTALGEVHDLDPGRIVCGAGSDEIIALLCQAYSGPGTEVLHTRHGFSMYKISALAAGATPVDVPETDRRVDVDALLGAMGKATRLVFVTNPGNPTGTMLTPDELVRLADGLPADALLVLDGAYAEYADDGYDGGAALVTERENVVMTRTFSKAYGLGGLRVGWAYAAPDVIDVLNRVRGPFNLGDLQLAAAEAALHDRDFVTRTVSETKRLRGWLAEALAALGIPSDPSSANYVLARLADQAEAEACEAHLRAEGLLVRKVAGYGLPECLRITIGDEAACRRVADNIARFRGQGV